MKNLVINVEELKAELEELASEGIARTRSKDNALTMKQFIIDKYSNEEEGFVLPSSTALEILAHPTLAEIKPAKTNKNAVLVTYA